VRFTAVCLIVASVVTVAGGAMAPTARGAVAVGAFLAAATQAGSFWIFSAWLFPGKMWEGYGLGLLARMAVFGVVALWAVPALGMPFGPTLFSLATVFWLTTMVEPLFLKARTSNTTQ
jgi:hypothetical protein